MCVCRLHWRIDVFISEYAGTCESYKEFYCPSVIWAPRNSGEGYGEYVWEVVVCIGLFRKCNQYFWFNEFCAWYCEAVFVCLQWVQLVRRRWPKSRRPHQVQADRQQPQWSRRRRHKVRKHWPRRRQRQQLQIRRPLPTQRQQNRRLISQVCVPYHFYIQRRIFFFCEIWMRDRSQKEPPSHFHVRIQNFLTEFLPLPDWSNSKNFAGSAALAEICCLRVLLKFRDGVLKSCNDAALGAVKAHSVFFFIIILYYAERQHKNHSSKE